MEGHSTDFQCNNNASHKLSFFAFFVFQPLLSDIIKLCVVSGSVQETTQMQIKLQQAQSAKALCENLNKVLQVSIPSVTHQPCGVAQAECKSDLFARLFVPQEDLADLKEQITMYESAVKHGVIGLDLSEEWENQLSDSCVDLGLKKSNRKNGLLHRYRQPQSPGLKSRRHQPYSPAAETHSLSMHFGQLCTGSAVRLEAAQRRCHAAAASGDAALPRQPEREAAEDQSAAGGAEALSGPGERAAGPVG